MSFTNALSPKPDNLPGMGSVWQHKKGAFYRVAIVSRHSEDPDIWLVTYVPVVGGDAWTRAFAEYRHDEWPGFSDEGRFEHVGGPRTWKDETPDEGSPEQPTYAELLDMHDDLSASFENVMLQFKGQMYRADASARAERVKKARELCDRLLRAA